MRREQHVVVDKEKQLFRCFNCDAEESYEHHSLAGAYAMARARFFRDHDGCPPPADGDARNEEEGASEDEDEDEDEDESEPEPKASRGSEVRPRGNGQAHDVVVTSKEAVKVKARSKCSRCGEPGHNAKTCEKSNLDRLEHGAPARAKTLRKKREGHPGLDPKTDAASPRAPAIAPASPVNGITIHTEHSIVSVTTEGGATVIRVREVGREG